MAVFIAVFLERFYIYIDHGLRPWYIQVMEEIAISKFKATCLGVLEKVRKTHQPVLVTRFGKPVAEIVPPSVRERTETWIGSMAENGRIIGDIVEAVAGEDEWEVLGS